MPRRQRPRKQAPATSDQAAVDVPKTISPQAQEAYWEMVFAMHLAQAIEDHLQIDRDRPESPPAPNQVG